MNFKESVHCEQNNLDVGHANDEYLVRLLLYRPPYKVNTSVEQAFHTLKVPAVRMDHI